MSRHHEGQLVHASSVARPMREGMTIFAVCQWQHSNTFNGIIMKRSQQTAAFAVPTAEKHKETKIVNAFLHGVKIER